MTAQETIFPKRRMSEHSGDFAGHEATMSAPWRLEPAADANDLPSVTLQYATKLQQKSRSCALSPNEYRLILQNRPTFEQLGVLTVAYVRRGDFGLYFVEANRKRSRESKLAFGSPRSGQLHPKEHGATPTLLIRHIDRSKPRMPSDAARIGNDVHGRMVEQISVCSVDVAKAEAFGGGVINQFLTRGGNKQLSYIIHRPALAHVFTPASQLDAEFEAATYFGEETEPLQLRLS